jgi:hypothetical protein
MRFRLFLKYLCLVPFLLVAEAVFSQIEAPSSLELSQGDFSLTIWAIWPKVEGAKAYRIEAKIEGARYLSVDRVTLENKVQIYNYDYEGIYEITVYSCTDEKCSTQSENSISGTGFAAYSNNETQQDILVIYDEAPGKLNFSTEPSNRLEIAACEDEECDYWRRRTVGGNYIEVTSTDISFLSVRVCEWKTENDLYGDVCERKRTIFPFSLPENWADYAGKSFTISTSGEISDVTAGSDDDTNNNQSESDTNSNNSSSGQDSTSGGNTDDGSAKDEEDDADSSLVVATSGLKWSLGNWGESTWYKESTSITGSSEDIIPDIPQQSLARISRVDKTLSKAAISMGASKDNGNTTSTKFKEDDNIILTAEIYPEPNDLGESGELYVVLVNRLNGKKEFFALEDSVWVTWNQSLKTLPAAKYVDNLSNKESILIYSGYMTAGIRNIYVGYSILTESGKPLIHFNGIPFKIEVTQ